MTMNISDFMHRPPGWSAPGFLLACVLLAGCSGSAPTAQSEQGPFLTDVDLQEIPGLEYNLTVLAIETRALSPFAPRYATSPDFMDDDTLAFVNHSGIHKAYLGSAGVTHISSEPVLVVAANQAAIYIGNWSVPGILRIMEIPLAGGATRVVFEATSPDTRACDGILSGDVSPSGRFLVASLSCEHLGNERVQTLVLIDLETLQARELGARGDEPSFDGDASILLAGGVGRTSIVRFDLATNESTLLYTTSANQTIKAAWALTDGRLAFIQITWKEARQGFLLRYSVSDEVTLLGNDGNTMILLRTEKWIIRGFDVSPNGEFIALAFAGERPQQP